MQLVIGQNYFVRTVTDYWIGKLEEINGPYTVSLTDAAWIEDTGRLSQFMKTGKTEQMAIEPVGPIMSQFLSILPWPHGLFKETV